MFTQTLNVGGAAFTCNFAFEPDYCPICNKGVHPVRVHIAADLAPNKMEIVFLCPRANCSQLFIARYWKASSTGNTIGYAFEGSVPRSPQAPVIPEVVDNTIPDFKKIYAQATAAEDFGLDEICGAGYRRSLEFLIKGFLLHGNTDEERAGRVRRMLLGPCIQECVTNENLKQVARRAAWLGNDETHYERRWEDKDLNDLKAAIRLTISWIETELLTAQLLAEMPGTT